MADKELKYNASKYYDETAFKAMSNVQKEDDIVGEIYEIELSNGKKGFAVVLSCDWKFCNILRLRDDMTDNTDLKIICKGIKYTSTHCIGMCYKDKLGYFVRKLTEEELQEIRDKLAKTLQIGIKEVVKEVEIVKEVEVVKEAESDDMESKLELELMKAQLDVYKSMVEKMIGR